MERFNRGSNTRKLVILALLIGLNIVLSRMASLRIPMGGVEGVRIGFGPFPVIFAGMIYGPVAGAIVGGVGDLIGYFVNTTGPYMPHFTVTAALRGFIPGLVWLLMRRKEGFFSILIPVFCSGLFSALAVPLLIQHLFNVPLKATMTASLISMCFTVPLYSWMFLQTYGHLHRRGILERALQ